jgi:hypothetical protein
LIPSTIKSRIRSPSSWSSVKHTTDIVSIVGIIGTISYSCSFVSWKTRNITLYNRFKQCCWLYIYFTFNGNITCINFICQNSFDITHRIFPHDIYGSWYKQKQILLSQHSNICNNNKYPNNSPLNSKYRFIKNYQYRHIITCQLKEYVMTLWTDVNILIINRLEIKFSLVKLNSKYRRNLKKFLSDHECKYRRRQSKRLMNKLSDSLA